MFIDNRIGYVYLKNCKVKKGGNVYGKEKYIIDLTEYAS